MTLAVDRRRSRRGGSCQTDGLTRALIDAREPACVTGIGAGWIINWRPTPPVTFSEAVDAGLVRGEAFRLAMLDAGVLLPPYAITDCRVCLAFTDDDVDQTIDAARWALGRLNDQ